MDTVYGELVQLLAADAAPPSAARSIATVTRVLDADSDGRGIFAAATLGELPLDADDIVFLQHTAGRVLPGERLLLSPADAGAQSYYCIGRF